MSRDSQNYTVYKISMVFQGTLFEKCFPNSSLNNPFIPSLLDFLLRWRPPTSRGHGSYWVWVERGHGSPQGGGDRCHRRLASSKAFGFLRDERIVIFVTCSPQICGKYVHALRIQNSSGSFLIWAPQCFGGEPSPACGRTGSGSCLGQEDGEQSVHVGLFDGDSGSTQLWTLLGSVWAGPGGKRCWGGLLAWVGEGKHRVSGDGVEG